MPGSQHKSRWLLWIAVASASLAIAMIAILSAGNTPVKSQPSPELVVSTRSVQWEGGMCLQLHKWSDNGWQGTGSSNFYDASAGDWGSFGESAFCDAALVGGAVLMPADASTGTYRICDQAGADCLEFTYEPGE